MWVHLYSLWLGVIYLFFFWLLPFSFLMGLTSCFSLFPAFVISYPTFISFTSGLTVNTCVSPATNHVNIVYIVLTACKAPNSPHIVRLLHYTTWICLRWMRILTAPTVEPCSTETKRHPFGFNYSPIESKIKKNKAGLSRPSDDFASFHLQYKDVQCGVASCRSHGQFRLQAHKSTWTHIVVCVGSD